MNETQNKIYCSLLDDIRDGRLGLNDRLEPEVALGKRFGTHRMDAHAAIKELQKHEIVVRNKRQGTFIARVPEDFLLNKLKKSAKRSICIIKAAADNSQFSGWQNQIFDGIEKQLRDKGVAVSFKILKENSLDELKGIIQQLDAAGCKAVVAACFDQFISLAKEHPETLARFHNDIFVFDRFKNQWEDWPFQVVFMDDFGTGFSCAEYLHGKGYRKIVFCHEGDIEAYGDGAEAVDWARGLKFGSVNLTGNTDSIAMLELTESGIDELITELKETPHTALAVTHDTLAGTFIDQASKAGLQAGDDYGIMSFDGFGAYQEYALTTCFPPIDKVIDRMSQMILRKVDGECCGETHMIKIPSVIVEREST